MEHLNKMLDVCIASYLYALEAFESNDRESALKTIEKETEADGLEISPPRKAYQASYQPAV